MSLPGWLRRIAGAVSHADTGPYAGAPRDPQLRVGDEQAYSTIRYTSDQVSYTTISTGDGHCPHCGRPAARTHRLTRNDAVLGTVRTCRECRTGTWLRESGMPASVRAREAARKHIV